MPSIRKTKKALKGAITELYQDLNACNCKTLRGLYLADAIHQHIQLLKQKLQQLKKKKKTWHKKQSPTKSSNC